ncbi:MAG: FUSC family protein [Bradyrhizobium sp.]
MKLIVAAIRPFLDGVQMAVAVSLALFVAFYLQLDTPSWAGTTAVIVCQPVVGSALLKGAFRLVWSISLARSENLA